MPGSGDRYFVAIPLTAEARLAVDHWRAGLGLPGRLVPLQKLHVTLRFVGPAGQVGRERIVAALDAAELGGAFSFRIGGLGGFPKLWKGHGGLGGARGGWGGGIPSWRGVVDEAVASAGFGYEERPFRGHLTLARIRPPRDLRGPAARCPAGIDVPVTEVVFYRSRTRGRSVVYDPLDE